MAEREVEGMEKEERVESMDVEKEKIGNVK